jgi:SAM-dependent methyltransferase
MLAEAGPHGALLRIGGHVRRRWFSPSDPVDPFDRRYGLDTSGFVDARRLGSGHPHDPHSSSYWGTASSLFAGALTRWSQSLDAVPYSRHNYTLIDIGCGKGRVVMLASDSPFRKIIGVELSPSLVAVAQRNLQLWKTVPHLCHDVEVLCADALEVPFPETPVLVYLFNPFDAHVTQLFLHRLVALSQTRSAPIDIIYTRPEYADLFGRISTMQLLWNGDVLFSDEDAAADHFHGKAQGCSIYRLSPQRTK